MKLYEFSIVLNALGETPEEAWRAAVEGFTMDPGGISDQDITLIEEVDEDGEEFEPRKIVKDVKSDILIACKHAIEDLSGIIPLLEY